MSEEQAAVANDAGVSAASAEPAIRQAPSSVDLTSPSPTQNQVPPTEDKAEANAGQGADEKSSEANAEPKAEQKPSIDERYAEMLKNKGFDPATFQSDPTQLNKFLDAYSNLEREFTKARQAEKAAQTLKDVQPALPNANGQAEAPKEVSPMEEYEQAFSYSISPYLAANGVDTLEALWQSNPQMASYLAAQYNKGLVNALKENFQWEKDQAAKKQQEEALKTQFQKDLTDAETFTQKNLTEAKKNYPELDRMFKDHGVEDFFKHLEDHYTIPRTFLMSDPKWVEFFVKAAAGREAIAKMADHDKEIIAAYAKDLEKKNQAQLPAGAGGGDVLEPPKEFTTRRNSGARGVSL